MSIGSGRPYLSYTRIMVQQARAERRRRGARGVRGPRALAEELGRIQSFSRINQFSAVGVRQGNFAPRGRGGGQRAVRPITHRSLRRGAGGRARAGGGWGEFSCRMSTARHIPPPLAGEGTGGRNDRAREGAIPRPHSWGRGLRAKRAGGGGIQLQDVHGQAYYLFFFE